MGILRYSFRSYQKDQDIQYSRNIGDHSCKYSRTSVTRTMLARLPVLFLFSIQYILSQTTDI